MPEWIGKTVGKVRIEKAIARGGMAEVYLGTHLSLDRPVAVKVMHSFVEADPELQSRFEREAKVVAGLRHPNIVQIFDFDTVDGHPYIVMEYLRGISLASYLRDLHRRGQRLPPRQVARLLITIATALDYAHERGVIHRDIKPGNIILHTGTDDISMDRPITDQAEAVLTDFGLVRIAQAVTQTASGSVSGTPAYMSPEQAQGMKVDHRSDIYSLGVVLYEMVAGRIPFEADTSWTMIFKHINEPPPPIIGVQPAVQTVIERVLAKNPDSRYQTARAFASDYMHAIGMAAEASTLRMSLPLAPVPDEISQARRRGLAEQSSGEPGAVSGKPDSAPAPAWARLAAYIGIAVLILMLGSFLVLRLVAANQPTADPTALVEPTVESTEIHVTDHPTTDPNAVVPAPARSPVGVLRFQDGTALADSVTISTSSIPPPPEGSLYEVWLIRDDAEQRIGVGTIDFDQNPNGSLTFIDGEGTNLLSLYSGIEITIEPNDGNPNSSNNVAFSARLPGSGLTHVRHLLHSFDATPDQIGFVHGLNSSTRLLTDSAAQMLAALEAGAESDVLLHAEHMLTLIVGNQSTDYKDWNLNGSIDDPGDGYGLLLNGEHAGYIQGTFTHADLALTSPDATPNMLTHGEHVKISATNVSDWTAQLRTQLISLLENPSSPDREASIRQAVALANQIRVGLDLDGNERIEPIPGEGGALIVYEHAYYMADMLILPAGNQTPTP